MNYKVNTFVTTTQVKKENFTPVLVKVLERKPTGRVYIYIERFILRNWLMRSWRLVKSKIASWRPREEMQFESKGCLLVDFLLDLGRSVLSLKAFN